MSNNKNKFARQMMQFNCHALLTIEFSFSVLDSNGKRAGRDRPFLKLIADSTNADR